MYIGRHIRVKYPSFLFDSIKISTFPIVFRKYSNIKFHENPSSGSRVVPCGQTGGLKDRHDEASARFWQFCERACKGY